MKRRPARGGAKPDAFDRGDPEAKAADDFYTHVGRCAYGCPREPGCDPDPAVLCSHGRRYLKACRRKTKKREGV